MISINNFSAKKWACLHRNAFDQSLCWRRKTGFAGRSRQQNLDIVIDTFQMTRDDPVAPAIEARTEAKRNVDVSGQGLLLAGAAAGCRGPLIGIGRDPFAKLARRRIRRVRGPSRS